MLDRIKQCVLIGLAFSCIYSLFVGVLYLLQGPAPFERVGGTLGLVIATYLFGGISAGVVVGVLSPLARWRAGAILVGIIGAFFVFLGITVARSGLPSRWASDEWSALAVLSIFFGAFAGNHFWKDPIR